MAKMTRSGGGGSRRAANRGFSLMEIVIVMPMLAIISLALISVVTFASRLSRIVSNQIVAKNIAQSYFERMAIDNFADVTPANYPSATLVSSPPLYLDSVRRSRCSVDIRITGYGTATGGSANTLVHAGADWAPNEWAGDTLLVIGGTGRGQRAQIVSNTADTVALAATLSPTPTSGTCYAINGGKTVQIQTHWRYLNKSYDAKIESLVIDWGPRR